MLLLDYARRMCGGTEAITIAPIPQLVRGWRVVAQEYEEIYRKQFVMDEFRKASRQLWNHGQ